MPVTTIQFPKPPANTAMFEANDQLSLPWRQYFDTLAQAIDVIVPDAGSYPHGVTDGSDAAAGDIGEFLEATTTSSVSMTSSTPSDILTLNLGPGDWDVWGWVGVDFASGGSTAAATWGIDGIDTRVPGGTFTTSLQISGWTGAHRYSTAAGLTTVALTVNASFSAGTADAVGIIRARRRR
jgi:hypothetical protein